MIFLQISNPLYNTKESFEKEKADSLSLTDKPLHYTTFHKNLY